MPIVIPKALPAFSILKHENIFVMPRARAMMQDIRPIEIAIVNLMPTKIETETQLMRLLGNTSLQVNVTLVTMESYVGKHTPLEHMERFYKTFDSIKNTHFDGMIITGAPVENMDYDDVKYWPELETIMAFADEYVTSTIYICWGAQAALHYYYGIDKIRLDKKLFGVYPYRAEDEYELLLKGMDDTFYIPMSRHTRVNEEQVRRNKSLKVLASSEEQGISILKSKDNRKFFFFGHSEYDRDTLKLEYLRDKTKGLDIDEPVGYFRNGNVDDVIMSWKSTANLLFYNWLNYYVYQVTPYDFDADVAK